MAEVASIVPLWRAAVTDPRAESEREATASLLFDVPVSALGALLAHARRRSVPAGGVVRRQDEISNELSYLDRGLLRQMLITPSGAERVIGMVKPGCIFGEALFIHGCPALSTVVAVEPSVVYDFPRPAMQRLFATTPGLWEEIARSLSFKVRLLTTQMWIMTSERSTTRVRKALYALAERVPPGTALGLTQQEIADLAGVHRVTATTVLADLRRRGIVKAVRGQLIVKQRERLLADTARSRRRVR